MPDQDRLIKILEECRSDLAPHLSTDLVREVGKVQVQYQFAGDDRRIAQKELRSLLTAALPVTSPQSEQ